MLVPLAMLATALAAAAPLAPGGASRQSPPGEEPRPLPFDAGWELSGDETRVEDYRGARALRLNTGRAVRRDVVLQDGTIEFDVEMTPHRAFVYVQFRMASDEEYEEIYFRPHKSELGDAIQYAPVWRGDSNWQLYHGRGATAPAAFARATWIHVRLVLSGRRAALFVGTDSAPAMVAALAREPAAGYIALRSFLAVDGLPRGESAAAYANVVVRPGHVPYDFGPTPSAPSTPAGLVTRWQLSPAFAAEPGRPVSRIPDSLLASKLRWPSFAAEPGGLLVIGRHVARAARQSAAVARLVVRAESERLQRLELGYSDYVTVLVNGRPLFAGDQHYSYDQPRQEGLIGLWEATLWLPLRRGDNEILLVVSDSFGGWGLVGRLEPSDGGRVVVGQ